MTTHARHPLARTLAARAAAPRRRRRARAAGRRRAARRVRRQRAPPQRTTRGQILLNNYPGWIGKSELAAFAKKYPGDSVKMVTNATSSVAEVILQYKTGNFDVLLSDTTDARAGRRGRTDREARLVEDPEHQKVSANFRKAYPWGIPTDYGKVGIAYRPDIVGEKITSWHDVWRLAPKFSRQGRVHRPRARLHRQHAQVPRLLVEHERREADRRRPRTRSSRSSRTCRRSSTRTSARASSTARP